MDRRRLKRLQVLIQRKLSNLESGLHHGYFGTEGFDIRDIRPYEHGDSLARVHWQNTARAGELMVWEAEPEIAVLHGVVVDASASMFFGTEDRMKIDVASMVAAVVAEVGSRNGNRFGALIAGEQTSPFKAGQGERHVARLLGLLSQTSTDDGSNPAFKQALGQYNARFKRRGIAVVVSDFIHPGWEDEIRQIAKKHTVLCVRVIDKTELKLENVGDIPFEDPVTGEIEWFDTALKENREAYQRQMQEVQRSIKQKILGSGAEYFELHTHGDQLEEFIHQLNRRNQQLTRGRRVA